MEDMNSDWARFRSHSALKGDLIEAKLHSSLAQIGQFVDKFVEKDVQAAKRDFKEAQAYLNQAADKAEGNYTDEAYKDQVTNVEQAVESSLRKRISCKPTTARQVEEGTSADDPSSDTRKLKGLGRPMP